MKTYTSIEALESRIAPAGIQFAMLANDLTTKLHSIQLAIDNAIALGSLLPVVGDKIGDAGKVIDQFAGQLINSIAGLENGDGLDPTVRSAIFSVLGDGGLNLLGDYDGLNGITDADIIITHPSGLGSILVDLNLRAAGMLQANVDFKIGLDALPISLELVGGVALSAAIEYKHLKFGINSDGFQFDTSSSSLDIDFSAALTPGTMINATVGFLSAVIQDGEYGVASADSRHTRLDGHVSVALGQGNNSSTATFDVSATLALQIDATIDPSFPGIGADLLVTYGGFNANDPAPTAEFKNVRVDLGGAISGVLEPIFSKLEPILAPFTPILDFVSAPIPVLSDLSNAIGQGDVSLLTISGIGSGYGSQENDGFISLAESVVKVLDFMDRFKTNPASRHLMFSVGDLGIGDSGGGDLRFATAAGSIGGTAFGMPLSNLVPSGGAFDLTTKLADFLNGVDPALGGLVDELKDTISGVTNTDGIKYAFPFLDDPKSALFGMLVGRDADLFTLSAHFKVGGDFAVDFPIALGFEVGLAGEASADFQLDIGYDTFGLRTFVKNSLTDTQTPADFLDGIYINGETSHIKLLGEISANAGFDAVVVSVKVEGGVRLGVELAVATPIADLDGGNIAKVHIRRELGPDCLFELHGKAEAFLRVAAKVGIGELSITKHFDIATVTLFQFGDAPLKLCIPNPFAVPPEIHLGSTHADDASIPEHTLRLNVGAHASDRNIPGPLDPNEIYQVFPGSKPGEVRIFAFGVVQTFSGITKIIGDAGDGNDSLIFTSQKDGNQLSANVELSGGDGDDQLIFDGVGNTKFFGGAGNDWLKAGGGNNYLNGGDGDDNITGGTGPNFLGAFTLDGTLRRELGNDTLLGGKGLNKIDGDDGNDVLFAGDTNGDVLIGGSGNDQLVAGTGKSAFLGKQGDDTFLWKDGNGIPLLMDGGDDANNSLQIIGSDMNDSFAISRNGNDSRSRFDVTTGAKAPFFFPATAINNVLIDGGKGLDTITVFSLTGTAVRNVGLNLGDVIKKKSGQDDLEVDVINVLGSFAADIVQIEAEQVVISEFGHDETLLGGVMKVSGLQSYTVRLANVADDFTYNAAGGNDATTILSNTGPTRLLGNLGNDTFTIAAAKLGNLADPFDPTNPKDYIAAVNVDAGSGTNKLTFDESASELAETILFGQTQFYSKLIPAATFLATGGTYKGGVTVKGGQFADNINLPGTLAGVTTSILSGAGSDIINIGGINGSSGSLDAIRGPIHIDAGFGLNQLLLVDVSDTNGNANASITASQVLKLAGASDNIAISYTANGGTLGITIEGSNTAADIFTLTSPSADVNLRGNAGNYSVKVTALAPTNNLAFSGGQGDDSLTLGAGIHTLDGFKSLVTFHGDAGNDTLTLDDAANLVQRNFDINATSFSFTSAIGTGLVEADAALEIANVLGGKFANTFNVKTANVLVGRVNIDGTAGNDTMQGPDAASIWEITGTNAGVLNNNVHFIRTPNLFGGSKSDRFIFANGKGMTGNIDGDVGNAFGAAVADTLDYSAFTTGVTVNLKTGKASNVGGTISFIENVTGGLAGDVIVGSNIANIINGGAGRDVLIGGLGADTINAGIDEDIIIGGRTDFDTDAIALQAISKVWRGPTDYAHRIAKLIAGVGIGAATKLNDSTVHNDLITDGLYGGTDTQDWFFVHLAVGGPLPGIDLTDFAVTTERNG